MTGRRAGRPAGAGAVEGTLPRGEDQMDFTYNLPRRKKSGMAWRSLFQAATVVGVFALATLLVTITNQSFGLVAWEYETHPDDLVAGKTFAEITRQEHLDLLSAHLSARVYARMDGEEPFAERDLDALRDATLERVADPAVAEPYTLRESILNRAAIQEEWRGKDSVALSWQSWISLRFLLDEQSSHAQLAGVRTAILGSLWTIFITMLIAFPLGVGAAVYLEEYAEQNRVNSIIQTNINNLAGVPSIIYGMLGLAIFVRALEPVTSGAFLGMSDAATANGRTIVSAALTLAILILPLIIINAQEAIRAVPSSMREAGYGLGGTKWQTVRSHVLPSAMPGIMTGTILSMSRAIGETAPLVVVGAATFIAVDPDSPFSKFTTLPIQIYQWTSRPQDEFRHIAAAAILVLLALLLTMNATAILLRNHFRRRV